MKKANWIYFEFSHDYNGKMTKFPCRCLIDGTNIQSKDNGFDGWESDNTSNVYECYPEVREAFKIAKRKHKLERYYERR